MIFRRLLWIVRFRFHAISRAAGATGMPPNPKISKTAVARDLVWPAIVGCLYLLVNPSVPLAFSAVLVVVGAGVGYVSYTSNLQILGMVSAWTPRTATDIERSRLLSDLSAMTTYDTLAAVAFGVSTAGLMLASGHGTIERPLLAVTAGLCTHMMHSLIRTVSTTWLITRGAVTDRYTRDNRQV